MNFKSMKNNLIRSNLVNKYIQSWNVWCLRIFGFPLKAILQYDKNYATIDICLFEEIVMSGHETILEFEEYLLQNWGKEGLNLYKKFYKYRYE